MKNQIISYQIQDENDGDIMGTIQIVGFPPIKTLEEMIKFVDGDIETNNNKKKKGTGVLILFYCILN